MQRGGFGRAAATRGRGAELTLRLAALIRGLCSLLLRYTQVSQRPDGLASDEQRAVLVELTSWVGWVVEAARTHERATGEGE